MTTTTKKHFKSKKGTIINTGERVTLSFDIKSKSTGEPLPCYVRMTTEDGRRISTANFKAAGIRVPSLPTLERWSSDSICKSIFGDTVEPDGWDSNDSPSWLLALGLI